jgi:hypothetical protein
LTFTTTAFAGSSWFGQSCSRSGLAVGPFALYRTGAGQHRVSPTRRGRGALDRFAEFSGKREKRYPAIIRLWENAWAEFVPFLAFDREIRTVICATNAIESIDARLRRAVNARGHFPTGLPSALLRDTVGRGVSTARKYRNARGRRWPRGDA